MGWLVYGETLGIQVLRSFIFNIQGVPRNMTVGEYFKMSSSNYWIRFKDFLQFSSLEKSFTPIYLNL